jgi:hypothetical protein
MKAGRHEGLEAGKPGGFLNFLLSSILAFWLSGDRSFKPDEHR